MIRGVKLRPAEEIALHLGAPFPADLSKLLGHLHSLRNRRNAESLQSSTMVRTIIAAFLADASSVSDAAVEPSVSSGTSRSSLMKERSILILSNGKRSK